MAKQMHFDLLYLSYKIWNEYDKSPNKTFLIDNKYTRVPESMKRSEISLLLARISPWLMDPLKDLNPSKRDWKQEPL